jgi:hypothetical protein
MIANIIKYIAGSIIAFSFLSSASAVLITEVQFNPAGPEAEAERFELFNPDSVDIDISGWVVSEEE